METQKTLEQLQIEHDTCLYQNWLEGKVSSNTWLGLEAEMESALGAIMRLEGVKVFSSFVAEEIAENCRAVFLENARKALSNNLEG